MHNVAYTPDPETNPLGRQEATPTKSHLRLRHGQRPMGRLEQEAEAGHPHLDRHGGHSVNGGVWSGKGTSHEFDRGKGNGNGDGA
jgi:hypothetical protein